MSMLFNILNAISNKHPLNEPLTITIHNDFNAGNINLSSYLALKKHGNISNNDIHLQYRTRYIIENNVYNISSLDDLTKIEHEFKKRGIIYSDWIEYTLDDEISWNLSKNNFCIQQFQFRNLTNKFSTSSSNYMQFYFNTNVGTNYWPCYIYLSNNINSLINFKDLSEINERYCFYKLFYDFRKNIKIFADKLLLPSMTLTDYCYLEMFKMCTGLQNTPNLPALSLANNCYESMFEGCELLTQAVDILPATTLANICYKKMFYDCKSLIKAPKLPATSLRSSECYQEMFSNCQSLNNINVGFTSWDERCTRFWVSNVSTSGLFICPQSLYIPDKNHRNNSNIPRDWDVESIQY